MASTMESLPSSNTLFQTYKHQMAMVKRSPFSSQTFYQIHKKAQSMWKWQL